jgi:hypothetical protein
MDTSPTPPREVVRHLLCEICGNMTAHKQPELLERFDKDWPRCCGIDMVIVMNDGQELTPKEPVEALNPPS